MTPRVQRLTPGDANDQLLYFTSSSLTADDRTLVFLSDRGSPVPKAEDPRAQVNLFALDRPGGAIRQLTHNRAGYLRSYVYFEGLPHAGLGLASVSLNAATGDVYYVEGDELRTVNARTGAGRTLARLPAGVVTAFTHVSENNRRVCVPTIDEAAFSGDDPRRTDEVVQRLGLASHLRVFDVDCGAEIAVIPVPLGWVTHVQFRPGHPEHILFNHEWTPDSGWRRLWLWDGREIRRLRPEGVNVNGTERRRDDWVCHEVWSPDGEAIFYHGAHRGTTGRHFLGRMNADGSDPVEIAFPPELQRYGHFTLGRSTAELVSDGYAEFPDDTPVPQLGTSRSWGGEWIARVTADWERAAVSWTPLCRHSSSWESQDCHPHPIYSHAGDEVLFTSDAEGRRAIYAVTADGPAPAHP